MLFPCKGWEADGGVENTVVVEELFHMRVARLRLSHRLLGGGGGCYALLLMASSSCSAAVVASAVLGLAAVAGGFVGFWLAASTSRGDCRAASWV